MWAVQNENWFMLPFSMLLMYGFAEAAWHSFTGQLKLKS
jgi:hypothetical protein